MDVETLIELGSLLPDGFSLLDSSGIHVAVNDPFCEMVGYSREELVGSAPEQLYWPDEERETIRQALARTFDGQFGHFQLVFCRKNGERFPVVVSPNVVRGDDPAATYFFATVKDLSEIAHAREAVAESEARYRALADSTPYGIAVHVNGIVRYVNAAAEAILGATAEELVGQPITRFVHPDDQPQVSARVRALSDQLPKTTWARERFQRLDGSVLHVEVAGARVRFEDQPAVQVAFRDVTENLERERAEAEANRLEAIGRLAGGVAHDFNNLLTVVLGATSFVLDHPELPADARDDLKATVQAARHGAALTSQLLAFSRQQSLEPRGLSLSAEIRRLGPFLDRMVGEDVTIELQVAPDCWDIRADPTQLERVLLNIVANARAAMPQGGRLTVTAANAPAGTHAAPLPATQDFVRIDIADEGVGMDAATRAQVFEPFFTTRRETGGTGLGLATVHGIVGHSGGAVLLESEVGKGTTVTIFWPRETSESSRTQGPASTRRTSGAETILLVEDQALVRRMAVRALERDGYRVISTEGYTDAVAELERDQAIDLLLTDVVLQDRTGPDIATEALRLRPSLPVLFMSGYADAPGLSDHANCPLLQKPFSPEVLSRTVRELLDQALDQLS
ncbi:MAG: PAS domain S-box protein [Deltaproteobacteria bacterium]|nr:PAS domain S-box protein [Deltaproteobacteria bacterium]